MPIYIYENESGDRIEEMRHISERDNAPAGFKRIEEPQLVSVSGIASSPTNMKEGVLKGYYREECNAGSRWKSDYSKSQIKKVWS